MTLPILWSFRRCPYAMRARLALASSGIRCELREIVLRDKPQSFLDTSPSATVPCLDTGTAIVDESLDIMVWALGQHDPERWLDMPLDGNDLIKACDGPFKTALDRYKYPSRYSEADPEAERDQASTLLWTLHAQLARQLYLYGDSPTIADMAILPFIRQFAHVDPEWFQAQDWTAVTSWLDRFKTSDRFAAIMQKYPQWSADTAHIAFP